MTSKEMFVNMTHIPDPESREYEAFFANERDKIDYGVTINGFHIGGWLYWHLNHWHINVDDVDPRNGQIKRITKNPDLRDNELYFDKMYTRASIEKKGLMLFGTRRFAKSEILASHIARCATLYDNSENVIAGGFDGDIQIITSKVDMGLNLMHPYFRMIRIKSNWNKEVQLGFKDKKNNNYEWSKILIRNFEEGTNPKVLEGITPISLVLDEVGKYKFLEALEAAAPSFNTPFGWRCVPICTGTGGNFVINSDAEKLYKNPEAHNFLALEFPGVKKKRGTFISGTYRMDAKDRVLLGDYIQRKSGILIPADSELNDIPFQESDVERATKIIQDEIEVLKKSDDPKMALKHRMYFPLSPEDCFLNEDVNNFPLEAIEQHLLFLEQSEDPQYVRLFRDVSGNVQKSFDTHLKPIREFPVTKESLKDACIEIYEDRESERPIPGLYIAGADPYNQSASATSSSVGVVYIFKRMYDPIAGTFQYRIVASYAARPELMSDWLETVELLLEYYNAVCMPENEAISFIQWFDQRNKIHYLADGYNLLKEINPNTSITGRVKGLPATVKVQNHYMNLVLQYTKEKIQVGMNPITKEPMFKLGCSRIPDRMLLKEMLAFSSEGNFDRIIAFGHVLAYEAYLQKYFPVVDVPQEEVKEQPKPRIRSPFLVGGNSFYKHSSPFLPRK